MLFFGAPDFSQAWSFCVVVSEYYVWSADLSGRQSRTHANLKAHLLEIRSCRAPKSKRYVTEVRAPKGIYAVQNKDSVECFFRAPDFNLPGLFV